MSPQTSYIFTVSKFNSKAVLFTCWIKNCTLGALQMKMTATCGIQKFRWREKIKLVKMGGRQHRTTPACQILGGRDLCNPCGVDAYATNEFNFMAAWWKTHIWNQKLLCPIFASCVQTLWKATAQILLYVITPPRWGSIVLWWASVCLSVRDLQNYGELMIFAILCVLFGHGSFFFSLLRYDTIRDVILTCVRKPTWVSLIYRTVT